MSPQNIGILIILRYGHSKNNKHRERLCLKPPYLPKDKSSKRSSVVINHRPPPPAEVSSTREDALVSGEDTRSCHHTRIHFVTKYHTSHLFLYGSIHLPKNHFLSPKSNTPLPSFPLLRWHLSVNSNLPQKITPFPLDISHTYIRCT